MDSRRASVRCGVTSAAISCHTRSRYILLIGYRERRGLGFSVAARRGFRRAGCIYFVQRRFHRVEELFFIVQLGHRGCADVTARGNIAVPVQVADATALAAGATSREYLLGAPGSSGVYRQRFPGCEDFRVRSGDVPGQKTDAGIRRRRRQLHRRGRCAGRYTWWFTWPGVHREASESGSREKHCHASR